MFYEFHQLGSPDYIKSEKGINFSFPPHLHHCFEVIVVLRGEMRVTVDGNASMLRANEAMLIFPNQIHALDSVESEHFLCIFSPRLVQAFAVKTAGQIPLDNRFSLDDYLIRALDTLSENSSDFEKKGVLYSVCTQFEKGAVYTQRYTDMTKLLSAVFLFVEQNFGGDCSLTRLSRTLGYDYAYLSRFFKKMIGIPYNAYVNYYRLSYACYLLGNTALSVAECALESGYTSVRSFNRNFKEKFGFSPAIYRKNIKKPRYV